MVCPFIELLTIPGLLPQFSHNDMIMFQLLESCTCLSLWAESDVTRSTGRNCDFARALYPSRACLQMSHWVKCLGYHRTVSTERQGFKLSPGQSPAITSKSYCYTNVLHPKKPRSQPRLHIIFMHAAHHLKIRVITPCNNRTNPIRAKRGQGTTYSTTIFHGTGVADNSHASKRVGAKMDVHGRVFGRGVDK